MVRKLSFVLLMCLLVVPIYADVAFSSTGTFSNCQSPVGIASCSSNTMSLESLAAVSYGSLTYTGQSVAGPTNMLNEDLGYLTLNYSTAIPSGTFANWSGDLLFNFAFTNPAGQSVKYTDSVGVFVYYSTPSSSDAILSVSVASPSGSPSFTVGGVTYTVDNLHFETAGGKSSLDLTGTGNGKLYLYGDVTSVPEVGSIALLGLFLGASALITRKVRV